MLFLDCWYGFTHERSLDSHRVRCLNARTILRELCDELESGRLDEPEFCGICEEALSLLQSDPVVASEFAKSYAIVAPLLKEPPALSGSSQKKDKPDNETKSRNLRFAAADLAAALESRYFPVLCERLRLATEQKDVDQIELLTRAILSDLVARGWTLRELFKWHGKFLANDGRTFTENLDFMLQLLNRPAGAFSATLRVSGGSTIRKVATFGSFTLSTDVAHAVDKPHEERFAASDEYTTFAEGVFESVDFMSAAIIAHDELEPLLDALRFEYEPRLLQIDKRCLVVRRSDNRRILVHVTNPVPNPVESLDEHGFEAFTKKLASTLSSATLTKESKNRIETGTPPPPMTKPNRGRATTRNLLVAARRAREASRSNTTPQGRSRRGWASTWSRSSRWSRSRATRHGCGQWRTGHGTCSGRTRLRPRRRGERRSPHRRRCSRNSTKPKPPRAAGPR